MDVSVPYTDQSAYFEADPLEQAADLTIPALVQAHPVPGVTAFGGLLLDAVEPGRPVLELDPPPKPLDHRRRRGSPEPDTVFPLDLARGVHQPVSQIPVV